MKFSTLCEDFLLTSRVCTWTVVLLGPVSEEFSHGGNSVCLLYWGLKLKRYSISANTPECLWRGIIR